MPTILVVEEAGPSRRHLVEVLETRADFDVATTQPKEALTEVSQNRPDLVVIDQRMSKPETLHLVSNLREDFPYVPIILITAGSNTQAAIESLRRGASSYVPRKTIDTELIPTIKSLLRLVVPHRQRTGVSEAMQSCSFRFCLRNDFGLISSVVSYLEQAIRDLGTCDEADCVRVSVALLEALSNALYHGNLELQSSFRERDFDGYREAALARSQQPPYADRRIHIEAAITRHRIEFVIRDEGRGFDPSQLPEAPEGPNLDKVSGRGIMLMRTMMDEVIFNDTGNQVTMIKQCDHAPAPA